MSGFKRYQVTFDVAGESFEDACGQARELLRPGVGFTVRPVAGPLPSARGVLTVGTMRWSVTVPATCDGAPCELMVAFDPDRRRGVVLLLAGGPGNMEIGSPVQLQPRAMRDLRAAIDAWPEEVIARMVTEDVLCGCRPEICEGSSE